MIAANDGKGHVEPLEEVLVSPSAIVWKAYPRNPLIAVGSSTTGSKRTLHRSFQHVQCNVVQGMVLGDKKPQTLMV
jgi:hypothetical protein